MSAEPEPDAIQAAAEKALAANVDNLLWTISTGDAFASDAAAVIAVVAPLVRAQTLQEAAKAAERLAAPHGSELIPRDKVIAQYVADRIRELTGLASTGPQENKNG